MTSWEVRVLESYILCRILAVFSYGCCTSRIAPAATVHHLRDNGMGRTVQRNKRRSDYPQRKYLKWQWEFVHFLDIFCRLQGGWVCRWSAARTLQVTIAGMKSTGVGCRLQICRRGDPQRFNSAFAVPFFWGTAQCHS